MSSDEISPNQGLCRRGS